MHFNNNPITFLILSYLTFLSFHLLIKCEPTGTYTIKSKILRPKTSQHCYTQGLFFSETGDTLFESCGLYSTSSFRKYTYPSLSLLKQIILPRNYFGEGIAKCGNFIYQLTWREHQILQYQSDTLQLISYIKLPLKEGWGMSQYNTNELLLTDGSDKIYFAKCENDNTITIYNNITVTFPNTNTTVNKLNDLIYAKKHIWANRYFDNKIYKIDSSNGKVITTYTMDKLIEHEIQQKTLTQSKLNSGYVLNGIAYHKQQDVFLITGKEWGYYYEIQFN
jgi:glutamine cyclotransferase